MCHYIMLVNIDIHKGGSSSGGTPIARWFIMANPVKMDMAVPSIYETSISFFQSLFHTPFFTLPLQETHTKGHREANHVHPHDAG